MAFLRRNASLPVPLWVSLPCDVLCLSLAVLRERALTPGGPECPDKPGLTSASMQAAISAIPPQTRHMMVQDVQTLGDEALKVPRVHTNI